MSNNNNKTLRKSRAGVALGNRFSALPFFGEQGSPALKRTEVLTLQEASLLAGRTKLTTNRYLKQCEINPVCLVRAEGRGRPSPAYSRQEVEQSFGIVDPREQADDTMSEIVDSMLASGHLEIM